MSSTTLERLDHGSRLVLVSARSEAARLGDNVFATEHLLLALVSAHTETATLLSEAGAGADEVRRAVVARCGRPRRRPHHDALLASLGIDLTEVRRRADRTFGTEAVARATSRARPPPRRPLRTWISCSTPLPDPRGDSPLTGPWLEPIPRVRRILKRAIRDARPGRASPCHLLVALVTGREPACEILTGIGVDLRSLAAAARHRLEEGDGSADLAG
jgi:hypothetical protein